jgi:hypothetical protein
MDSQEFIERLKGVCESVHKDHPGSDSRYAFFLGAGCSVSSDIPSAGALVRDSWIPRLCKIKAPHRTDYLAFAKEQFPGYEHEKASSFYGQLIDALFITPNDRQREIEQLCEGKFPGFGYAALSKLVAHKSTAFNVVLTTNFDDLMADALYLYTEARPLVIHHESLAAFIRPTRMRPLVVKLHGDSRLSPKNTREETEDLGENLAKHIAMLLNDRGLIFMGYGGADESILKLLAALPEEALPSGVFWLSRSEPAGKVREWLHKRVGVWVKITDFDEFMLRAYAAFGMKHPSKAEFARMFGRYYETFGKMAAKVEKPEGSAAPDPALVDRLAAARRELPEDYKEVARAEALAATRPEEARQVLEAVVKKPGTSASAQLSAARTLVDKLFKYGEALTAYESALKLTIDEEGEDSEDAALVYAELARAKRLVGDLNGAEADIQKALDWGEAQSPRDERNLAIDYALRASIRRDRGDLAGAEADIQKAIAWFEAQSPRDERGFAIWHALRASIRQHRGDLAGAEADIQKALDWGEAQSPRDERGLAIWYALRANIRRDRGDLAGAEVDIQRAIDWEEAQSPRDERGLAIDYASRAYVRQDRGDLTGAEADIQRSIDWEEAQSPRDERGLAIWYASRANIRQDRGDLTGAEADIQRSIDWEEAQTKPNQRELALRYGWRASIRRDRGDLAGAEADIQKSIALGEAQSPRNERGLAIDYASRARVRRDQQQYTQALADVERSLAWAKAEQPIDDWCIAVWACDLATILAEMDRVPEAVAEIDACIAWHRQHQPGRRDRMAHFLRNQARILAMASDWPGAAAAISESLPLHEAVFGLEHEWTRKARAWQVAIANKKVPPRWIETRP